MTIRHLYPAVEPSLNLDFANSKRLDSRITFTRGSIGTYTDESGIIRTAAANEARFDHDSDGNSLGLLIEESRTNLFDQSEDLTSWTSSLYTKTNNQAISPDGTLNAGSLVPNVGVTSQSSGRTVTQSAGNHVCSVFAKPNGLTVLKIRFSGSSYQAFFDLTGNGSIVNAENGTASISKLQDGWYKCVFAINDSVGETAGWQIGHNDSSNVDGINGFYIWGMQVEANSYPTSYIPTSGSTVTRSADVASITGTNFSSWYNQSEGTVVASLLNINRNGSNAIWSFDNGTSSQRMMFRISRGLLTTGFSTLSDTTSPYTATHAFAIAANDLSGAKNGTLYTTPATTSTLPVVTQFQFGTSPGVQRASGHISRFTYYPVRLPDSTLQALTL